MQIVHRSHVRAEQAQLTREEMAQVEAYAGSGRRAARHQLPATFERSQALVPGCRADVLDHNVHAFFVRNLSNLLGNLLLVMIDAEVRAERASLLEFRFIARSGDNAALKELGDLDGGNPHA